MKRPSVSVVIPAYNRAHCIAEAVESALGQTVRECEILVVDDGSTDATPDVLARYRDRIRYLRQENAGPAAARNHGIRESRGEFVAFLDSDDLWLPVKLELQLEEFRRDERMGIVSTNVVFLYPDREARTLFGEQDTEAVRDGFLGEFLMVTSSVMVRAECFGRVGLFDETLQYAEDLDLFYRVARTYHCRILGGYLTINRRTGDGNMVTDPTKRERMVADTLRCYGRIFSYPENRTKGSRQRDRCRTFYRWIGLSDLYSHPGAARKYLFRSLRYRPWDVALYAPLLKSFLLGRGLYLRAQAVRRRWSW
ncbi:MAG: glycosyltransferase family A protein [Thermodesulfovibrionales bacterium]